MDEIWYINADYEVGDSHMTKYENFFKFQDGGRRPFKKTVLAITRADCLRYQFSQNFGNKTDTGIPQNILFLSASLYVSKRGAY